MSTNWLRMTRDGKDDWDYFGWLGIMESFQILYIKRLITISNNKKRTKNSSRSGLFLPNLKAFDIVFDEILSNFLLLL